MPRLDTFRRLPYKARLFNYTEVFNEQQGRVRTYSFVREINCDLTQSLFGRITILFGDDAKDVMPHARLEELVDRNGNEVYPGGIWTLQSITPNLTVFGTTEGFSGQAEITHSNEAV